MKEPILFHKGMNRRKNPLYMDDGETYTCSGFSMEHDGQLEARPAKTQSNAIDTTATSTINGIHRYIDSVLASSHAYCPGSQAYFNYIYQRDESSSSFTNIGLLANNTRPRFADYEKFTFVVDGESKRAYIDEKEYEWHIANPETAPTVAVGAAGNPDGEYTCTVTFYIIFPNGKAYETGGSPSSTITLSTEKCEWSAIPICTFEGDGLIIHRRLYRTVSGTAYLVTELKDNTTTTYSDDVTDTTLQVSTAYSTSNYSTPPDYCVDIEVYLQRIFLIKNNTLYWSEAYTPFGFKTTSSGVVTKEDEDLVGIIYWGDQLYIVSREKWYRLQGNDPTTWSIKQTFTDYGLINRHTIKKTKWGILGLGYDGIYLFDGSIATNITEKILGKSFFTDLDDLDVCYAEFDGDIYYFYYASSGSTLDSCLKLDFTFGRKELQAYLGDFVDAHDYYSETGTRYQAYAGYEYTEGGTETIMTSILSADKAFGDISKRKNLEYLHYDIDTGGADVTVTFYVDGSSSYTLTLNESSRKRGRSVKLPQLEGYRHSIGIDCSDSQSLVIYQPWFLEGNFVGE